MKVHELIGSMPREQRGSSLTESKASPAGEAGRAILAEALSKPYQPSAEPQEQKMRLKEFLHRMGGSQAVKCSIKATSAAVIEAAAVGSMPFSVERNNLIWPARGRKDEQADA